MNSPPPQPSLLSLIDDAIREILFRIPPGDPASLVRASAVCTTLFGIISDPAFLRSYRAFHGTPPILGYLHNKSQESHDVAQFVPTGPFCPLVCERRDWDAVDSRHGRVLFYTPEEKDTDFVVWDPITDNQRVISAGSELLEILCAGEEVTWMTAVLCAKDGCDHLGCHDGPFLVAFVGSNMVEKTMFAFVYSSETTEWSEMVSVENPNVVVTYPFGSVMHPYAIEESGHTAVVGKKVYFAVKWGYWSMRMVMYNVGEQELSLINLQDQARGILMGEEDGALVFAAMEETKLSVWSMEAGPNGVVARGQRRAIELEKILPPPALSWMVGNPFLDGRCTPVGFAKGAGVIFLNTEDGLFTVEVCSGRTKKINGKTFEPVIPYMSFYTREHAATAIKIIQVNRPPV
ncbi:uncharacterized protein [Aegilops tauschii subsp. strangulata]|uniref:F-box domain-containing protein n=1 Tax=Aegilops tauschii TaxID=37682 RepID=M8BNM5_AEGTA|nr:uncharacterized protein LOC109761016 [Aegilops tauschii subsp. strangulata]XP_020175400.1 uncharacterized protein LOC109761016 [Aegilops tauschii subsp. strangulata]